MFFESSVLMLEQVSVASQIEYVDAPAPLEPGSALAVAAAAFLQVLSFQPRI